MLMLLNCYAFLPTPRGVPAFGTVQPMRSIGPCTAGARTACRLPQHEIKQPTTTGAMAAFTSDKPQHAIRSLRSRGRIQQFKMGSKELPPEQENPFEVAVMRKLGQDALRWHPASPTLADERWPVELSGRAYRRSHSGQPSAA